MDKIIPEKIRAKNFLSFGNVWQEFVFPAGITLVQGVNVDTGKSNGSGKTSLTEIVSMALFGRTLKEIPQARIINWFNGSGCAVEFHFRIGADRYVFKRCLKPNKFNVKVNDKEIVRPADIKTFQYQVEQDIIGMDFKTFRNLICFSPNNTISILSAKKESKRQFLESLFDLSEYSDMLKITNGKIGNLSAKVSESELKIKNAKEMILAIQHDIDTTNTIDIVPIQKKINELTLTLEGLNQIHFDDVSPEWLVEEEENLKKLKELQIELGNKKWALTTKIESIEKAIDAIDIDTPTAQRTKIHKEIDELQEELDCMVDTEEQISDAMVQTKEEIQDYGDERNKHKEAITELQQKIKLCDYVIESCEENISTYKARENNMSGKTVCDFCGSEVDSINLKVHFESQKAEEATRMQVNLDMITDCGFQIAAINDLCNTIDNTIRDLVKHHNNLRDRLQRLADIHQNIKILQEKLSFIPDVAKLTIDMMAKKQEIEELQAQLRDVIWKFDLNKDDIESKEVWVDDMAKKCEEAAKHQIRRANLEEQLKSETETLNQWQKISEDQYTNINTKKQKIMDYQLEITTFGNEILRSNTLLDHLNYLRVSLKDENVKQFAISALLPYLNHRANYYLSESGFPYVAVIDGWLDVTIKGMGIEDVSYNSLSGGESKAMDMAIQLACNDIAELHAKTLLGFSFYDEILDSSLDADGVAKLMDIVRVKQRDTGNAILIISHRDEIKELDFDNYVMIEKENGFSTIQTQ